MTVDFDAEAPSPLVACAIEHAVRAAEAQLLFQADPVENEAMVVHAAFARRNARYILDLFLQEREA